MPCFAKRAVLKKTAESQTRTVHPRNKNLRKGRFQAHAGKQSGDEDIDSEDYYKLYKHEKKPKILQRAVGGEALENCRFGPDVVVDFMECTPLPLWKCEDPVVDYHAITTKTSTEIIPVSPKDLERKEGEGSIIEFQTTKSPALTWDPNLTDLEEDEFEAEAALIPDHFKLAYCLPLQSEDDIYEQAITTVQIKKADGSSEFKDRVRVILKETVTEIHFRIEGRVVLDGTPEAEVVREKNTKYQNLCQHHNESDIYTNRASQTFLDRERDKYTQFMGVGCLDKSQLVNDFIMFDDYNELKEKGRLQKAKEEEEAMMKSLAENTLESVPESTYQNSSDDSGSDEEDVEQFKSKVEWQKVDELFDLDEDVIPPDDMNDLDEELEIPTVEELDVKIQLDVLYASRLEKALMTRPKLLPDISYSVLILERIASTVKYQKKHMEIRGYEAIFKKDLTRRQMYQLRNDALVHTGPTLKRFWAYKPNFTKGFEVTSISVHPTNGNIIAASYGSNAYPQLDPSPEGLVCIWNLKSINFPERIYHFEGSVMIVVFSNLTPYLLAIGLMDGNIFVYDIRSNEPKVFCTTEKMLDKPFGPIWDLFWLQETEMASTGTVKEILVSVSDDGILYRWTSAKGFEPWVLLKVRRSPLKIPGRREKRAEALISQWSATYTVCFYPDDLTMYLIGTEEGFIHKCITSYAEQFVSTYVSHTGPVYAIRFSPFAKDIFISCGGDWCVKIWKEDFHNAPLLTLCTGLGTVFDVAWAPSMSSVFVCTNELYMEIWDVTVNTLEPIIQFKLPNLGLRRVSFYNYVQGLLIGDDDGGVTVYSLRNFPEQPESPDDKIDHLLEGLIPGYKREMTEETMDDRKKVTPAHFLMHQDDDVKEEEKEEDETEEGEEDDEETETESHKKLSEIAPGVTVTPLGKFSGRS